MDVEDLPEDRRWFLLTASGAGLSRLARQPEGVSIELAVRRELMSGWWPVPGARRGLAKVPRGAFGLLYVGAPVGGVIARLVLGAGPEARGDSLGYPLLAVEPLVPPAPYPKNTPPHQSRGVERLTKQQFDDTLAAVFGSSAWRPVGLEFDPVIYRRVQFVRLTEILWVRRQADARWPTVDRDGRVRFDRWRLPTSDDEDLGVVRRAFVRHDVGATDDPRLATTIAGEIVYEDYVDAIELPGDFRREQILAVGPDGQEVDVTDSAVDLALTTYEAGLAGTLSESRPESEREL